MNKALIFSYKIQRKFRRELRKRFTPQLVAWDRRELRTAMRNVDARSLLVDYANLLDGDWPEDMQSWLSQDESDAVVAKADEVSSHRFDLLGSGSKDLGDPIDWHCDFKTGFQWPDNVHHLMIAWDAVPSGTDIKMPWELSRAQHFITLGLAERVCGGGNYYEEFKSQTRSWIKSNECGFGVNWVCAMDVAIRAVNWLTAVALFRKNIEEDTDDSFVSELVDSLWLHGRHIMRNLEWQGPRSPSLANHFLADICGVLAVGTLFHGSRQGIRWQKFACRWFETEVRRQVFPDGSNFETSTSYHRLSNEMFLWADMIAKRLGRPFSEAYSKRLQGMSNFVSAYTTPSGRAVQFGDNDGGRFLTVGIEDPSDHRYLGTGSCGFGGRANRMLLGGGTSLPEGLTKDSFRDGGYWFGQVGDGWLGVRAGEVSHAGAHAHADQLTFALTVKGYDIVVDPGTGVYSGDVEKRNAYRSTSAHNSPRLNGLEANHFAGGMAGLFRMRDDTRTEVDVWRVAGDRVDFKGRHLGFWKAREGCVCEREAKLEEGCLTVRDRLSELRDGDLLEWSLRLAPDVQVEVGDDGVSLIAGDARIRILTEPPLEIEEVDKPFSPSYGVEVPSKCLQFKRKVEVPVRDTQRMVMSWV